MGGIRSTVEECAYIRKLFENLGVKVDERDIFMHKDYQCQLDTRLGIQNASVPHVFVNGVSLGVRKPTCMFHLAETHEDEITSIDVQLRFKRKLKFSIPKYRGNFLRR